MSDQNAGADLPLPKGWQQSVKSAVLHVLSLAQFTIASAQAKVIDNRDANPFQVRIQRLEHEIAWLRDEIRIKDARMQRIAAQRRPHYAPVQRLEILELRRRKGDGGLFAKWRRKGDGGLFAK